MGYIATQMQLQQNIGPNGISTLSNVTRIGLLAFNMIPSIPKTVKAFANIGTIIGNFYGPEYAAMGAIGSAIVSAIFYKPISPDANRELDKSKEEEIKKKPSQEEIILSIITFVGISSLGIIKTPKLVETFAAIGNELGDIGGPVPAAIGAISGAIVGAVVLAAISTEEKKTNEEE
jgi:hypothetical protein